MAADSHDTDSLPRRRKTPAVLWLVGLSVVLAAVSLIGSSPLMRSGHTLAGQQMDARSVEARPAHAIGAEVLPGAPAPAVAAAVSKPASSWRQTGFPLPASDPFAPPRALQNETLVWHERPSTCSELVGEGFVLAHRERRVDVCKSVRLYPHPQKDRLGVYFLEHARMLEPPAGEAKKDYRTYAVHSDCTHFSFEPKFGKTMYQAIKFELLPAVKGRAPCSAQKRVVDAPIVLHLTDGMLNLWHASHAFLGTLVSTLIAGVDPRAAQLYLPDKRTSSVDGFYRAFYSSVSVHPPPAGCYGQVVIGSTGAAFAAHFHDKVDCNTSSIAGWIARRAWMGMAVATRAPFNPWAHRAEQGKRVGQPVHAALLLDREFRIKKTNKGPKKSGRLVKNKEELRRVVTQHFDASWDAVDLGTLPLAQQVRLLSEHSVLVGVHGAGMTLGLFTNAGTTMIEMHPHSSAPWLYGNYCHWRGNVCHRYRVPKKDTVDGDLRNVVLDGEHFGAFLRDSERRWHSERGALPTVTLTAKSV